MSFDVSRDPQVLELWREVVRTHPSAIVRSEVARRYLYCFDDVICAHLVGLVDAPEPVEGGMVGRIVDAIGLILPPEEGKAKFESLAARVNDPSVWFNIAQDGVRKPGAWETLWFSTVIGWWRAHHANSAARLQISRIFRDGTPVPWTQGLDLQKKDDVLTLLEILRTNEVGKCSDPNWDVCAFAATAPVAHLPLLAEGVFTVAYGNDIALFEALAKVHDASVLAPILAERIPETCKVWESMLESLLTRDAKGWRSLLEACRKFLTTNDPKSAHIARIDAHLGKK